MPINDAAVRTVKTYLEALEKARALERDARAKLQKEGLSSEDQQRWAEILAAVSKTIQKIEEGLPAKLGELTKA